MCVCVCVCVHTSIIQVCTHYSRLSCIHSYLHQVVRCQRFISVVFEEVNITMIIFLWSAVVIHDQ